jgi:bacteriocin-like protein
MAARTTHRAGGLLKKKATKKKKGTISPNTSKIRQGRSDELSENELKKISGGFRTNLPKV